MSKDDTYILKNNSKNNFTIINNTFLTDSTISLAAKGLGATLLTKPPNWIINPTQLQKELNIGRDALSNYIKELITSGYMYKQNRVAFAKKGEQKVFYHISDCKKTLYDEIISKSQLPLPDLSNVDSPPTENPQYNNIVINKNINKKNTNLLSEYLDKFIDPFTKKNILKIKPNITIDEFKNLYDKCSLEVKNNYCKNINSCIILALQNRWNFRSKDEKEIVTDDKIHKVMKSKVNYYLELFEISNGNNSEIIELFKKECQKYDEKVVDIYLNILKEFLKKNG